MLLQVLSAMLTVLSATLGRVPTAVMRAKFGGAVQLLSQVVRESKEQVRQLLGA